MVTTHPTVKQLMTRKPITAGEDTPFKELARVMHANAISALPIVNDEGRVVGIVSEADLLLKEQHAGGQLPDPEWLGEGDRIAASTARELITWPVLTVPASASIARAARTMQESGVRHLVVVDRDGRPKGIVSRSDLLRVFLRPDAELKHHVVYGVGDGMLSINPAALDVQVQDGVVSLGGTLADQATADLLVSLVERLPGVVAVRNHLSTTGGEAAAGGRPYGPPPNVDQE